MGLRGCVAHRYTQVLEYVIPAGIAGIQMPWMAKLDFSVFLVIRKHVWACYSHPCVLDPGNPCRDDGVSQALVHNDQYKAVRQIICRVDSPLGNPPQLRLAVIGVVR